MADRQRAVSRRDLLRASAAAATLTIVPRHVLGGQGRPSANERLNIAAVGVGGMGANNLAACAGENIVALCDVDAGGYAAKTIAKYPKAKVYKDFRVMLDQQKDIDAVIVATPDHTHAVVALAAIRRGKHVYVQKPLTHSVYEARVLTEAARKYKVMTQMGNQGHSGDGPRLICEWIADGAIGAVREVHCWTNRPVWPQSIEVERPKETPPVPPTLDWDLWLGPAPVRPVPSHLSSRHVAGVVGLRHGVPRRPGLPHHGPGVLGLEAQVPRQRRGLHLDLLAGPVAEDRAEERAVSALDDRALQVPRAGGPAGSQTDVVGRRHDARAAGGPGEGPPHGRRRRRRALRRRQGPADVRLLRQGVRV